MILRTIQSGLLTLLAAAALIGVALFIWASNDAEFRRSLRSWAGERLLGETAVRPDAFRALQTTLDDRETELRKTRDELASARDRLRAGDDATADLQAELDAMRQRWTDTEAQAQRQDRQLADEKDRLEAEFDALRQRLADAAHAKDVDIERLKNNLAVFRVGEHILFDSGSARLKDGGREVLSLIAEALNSFPDRMVRVEGHTDDRPIVSDAVRARYPSNWELSSARAVAAVRYLEQAGGVDPHRLIAAGLGPWHPVASNDTPDTRAANRRIEIVLLPNSDELSVRPLELKQAD